jgi:hypothetical protein
MNGVFTTAASRLRYRTPTGFLIVRIDRVDVIAVLAKFAVSP